MSPHQAHSAWFVVDRVASVRTCITPWAHHNNRPVWLFECAILWAVCFARARQWRHLASHLLLGLLCHHGTPCHTTPYPQSTLPLHLFLLLGQLFSRQPLLATPKTQPHIWRIAEAMLAFRETQHALATFLLWGDLDMSNTIKWVSRAAILKILLCLLVQWQ